MDRILSLRSRVRVFCFSKSKRPFCNSILAVLSKTELKKTIENAQFSCLSSQAQNSFLVYRNLKNFRVQVLKCCGCFIRASTV